MCENELPTSRLSKVIVLQTYILTSAGIRKHLSECNYFTENKLPTTRKENVDSHAVASNKSNFSFQMNAHFRNLGHMLAGFADQYTAVHCLNTPSLR